MYGGHFPPAGHAEMLREPPFSFVDGGGRELSIRPYGGGPVADEYGALVDLFGDYDAGHRSLGIPPSDPDRIERWLDQILAGIAVLVWDGARAVGLAVLVRSGPGSHELAIFVHPDYHGVGVGTHLIEGLLTAGRARGVDHVWLLVERANDPALNLYRDVGFIVDADEGYDLRMALAM